jgi:hypothetical protein
MFKRLFAFLSRQPDPDYVDEVEDGSQSIEQAAICREAMETFMRLVSRQLGDDESERLTRNVLARFDDCEDPAGKDDAGEFFLEGLMDDDGQQRGKWMLIQVDWKASDEIDWQANEMLATHGIDDQWEWDSGGQTVMQGLKVLADRLTKHALTLLSVDLGHDAYYMLIVDNGVAEQAIEVGRRAGLDVMSFQDFAVTQGDG